MEPGVQPDAHCLVTHHDLPFDSCEKPKQWSHKMLRCVSWSRCRQDIRIRILLTRPSHEKLLQQVPPQLLDTGLSQPEVQQQMISHGGRRNRSRTRRSRTTRSMTRRSRETTRSTRNRSHGQQCCSQLVFFFQFSRSKPAWTPSWSKPTFFTAAGSGDASVPSAAMHTPSVKGHTSTRARSSVHA